MFRIGASTKECVEFRQDRQHAFGRDAVEDRCFLPPRADQALVAQRGKVAGQIGLCQPEAFAQFGSDLDDATKAKISRGQRIVELFKQNQYSPLSMEMEVAVLWAMQNGHFDDVDVERVKECQAALEEFLSTRKAELLQKIADEKALSDDTNVGLKTALEDFKGSWK